MNKLKLFVSVLFVLAVFSFLTSTEKAFATVGGPTYISGIASDTTNKFLYYTVNDNGGRGCPPIIHKVDLNTLQDAPVKSCDDFEKEFPYTEAGLQAYNQFISGVYQNLSYLGSVSLEKNNITVDVKFISEEVQYEGDYDYLGWTNFRARISQDGVELGSIDFRGCAEEQPHIFEGYMIPNSDKMAFLISNKGDCFEGGYVKEILHVIGGVKYYDTNVIRSFKTASATEPNVGNVVVSVPLEGGGYSGLSLKEDEFVVLRYGLAAFFSLLTLVALAGVTFLIIRLWKVYFKKNLLPQTETPQNIRIARILMIVGGLFVISPYIHRPVYIISSNILEWFIYALEKRLYSTPLSYFDSFEPILTVITESMRAPLIIFQFLIYAFIYVFMPLGGICFVVGLILYIVSKILHKKHP